MSAKGKEGICHVSISKTEAAERDHDGNHAGDWRFDDPSVSLDAFLVAEAGGGNWGGKGEKGGSLGMENESQWHPMAPNGTQ